MKVYAGMGTDMPLGDVGPYAQRIEAMGYDGLSVPETVHDGLMVAMLALEHTSQIEVGTNVILAFPRSPMITAIAAWDLQRFSGGRFSLGVGSQVKGNIEGRFSVPWKAPAARMREYLQSLLAIWEAFQSGSELRFEGEHYRFTRLQPYFNPGPIDHARPRLVLGAVNPAMCRVAGEVADGLSAHPTNSNPRFLREVTIPGIEEGARRAGRSRADVQLRAGNFITGATREEVDHTRAGQRKSFGFLYSTPNYWPTLDLYGWGEVGRRLHQLTREGKWDEMEGAITEEMIDTLMPSGTYEEIPDLIAEWYGGLVDGIGFPVPQDPARDRDVATVIERLQVI